MSSGRRSNPPAGGVAIRDAANFSRGRQLAFEFIDRYEGTYPSLIKAFKDDLDALVNHLKIPASHRRHVRTTNLIQRNFEEERRRTKVIPGFLREKSALKLVYSVLIRASDRWRRVRFTDTIECAVDGLRSELEIADGELLEARSIESLTKQRPSFYRKNET